MSEPYVFLCRGVLRVECPFCLRRIDVIFEATTKHSYVNFKCCDKRFFFRRIEGLEIADFNL